MNRFRQFYMEYGNKLFAYLFRKSGNRHLAADLVQESFTRYLERYPRGEENVRLLFTIGRNLFYDDRRYQQRFCHDEEVLEGAGIGQEERYLAQEQSQLLLAAMARLSDEERDILSLASGGDLCYRDIALLHRLSEANVKVKVHRARQKLKAMMQEQDHG